MNVIVTGGLGYIGSHVVVELMKLGHTVCILDDLSNTSVVVLSQIEKVTGRRPSLHVGDVRDYGSFVHCKYELGRVDAIVHLAGKKAVGESVANPVLYQSVNIGGMITLLEFMDTHQVNKLVFSSSATVYGANAPVPYHENSILGPSNPYGRTKLISEQLMQDFAESRPDACMVALRYFNPIGAHPTGLIGENPRGVPNNLMPYITQVAAEIRPSLTIHGGDYPTADGTAVRDYIHVQDLALGHIAALDHIQPGFDTFNLGSGRGTSVLQLVHAFQQATGVQIPYVVGTRRSGDLAEFFANPSKAQEKLGWSTTKTIEEMCADSWRFQSLYTL